MSNDDALISKLISETYLDSTEKDLPNAIGELRDYFEKKLNEVEFISMDDYLSQHGLSMSPLTLHTNTSCYRLICNKAVLDFPTNWSIFRDLKTENLIFVDSSLDQDFLLDIFSELRGEFTNLALVKEDEAVKLIYLPEEQSKEHIQWFRGFFEKKNQVEIIDSVVAEENSKNSEAA
jgi:hypothetical protein